MKVGRIKFRSDSLKAEAVQDLHRTIDRAAKAQGKVDALTQADVDKAVKAFAESMARWCDTQIDRSIIDSERYNGMHDAYSDCAAQIRGRAGLKP